MFILEPRVLGDERGFFFESYNERAMAEVGIVERFVQDNHSCSCRNVLHGLHYQIKQPQGKLVRVTDGEILDVAVDVRRSSPTLGHWEAARLSGENKRMLWIPVGFAHGFSVLSEKATVLYKATNFYAPEHEHTLAWNDPDWLFAGNSRVTQLCRQRTSGAWLFGTSRLSSSRSQSCPWGCCTA